MRRHRAPPRSIRHRGPRRSMETISAPAARALSAIRSAVTWPAGDIDDAQLRTADVQSLQSGRARHQQIARQHAPPGLRDETACGDIAAGPAHALPRDRFRQHLRQRAGQIHGIGIEHAVASLRHGVAGFDPDRQRSPMAAANRRMRRRDRVRKKRRAARAPPGRHAARLTGAAPVPGVPAPGVPVPPVLQAAAALRRPRDDVRGRRPDLLVAARAAVRLGRRRPGDPPEHPRLAPEVDHLLGTGVGAGAQHPARRLLGARAGRHRTAAATVPVRPRAHAARVGAGLGAGLPGWAPGRQARMGPMTAETTSPAPRLLSHTFASDNTSGVHPDVMAALAAANTGHAIAYGDDAWTHGRARRSATCSATSTCCSSGAAPARNVVGAAVAARAVPGGDLPRVGPHPRRRVRRARAVHRLQADRPCRRRRQAAARAGPRPAAPARRRAPRPAARRVDHPVDRDRARSTRPTRSRPSPRSRTRHGMLVHMDGARIANAAAALGGDVAGVHAPTPGSTCSPSAAPRTG